jgi:hypothetical protein
MLRRVALVRTDVSEEPSASIIWVTRIGELGTTLAVTSNRSTLQRTGVTSQKTPFFIVTAVKTSNLTTFFIVTAVKTSNLTETQLFLGSRAWLVRESDKLTAICEPTV